MMEIAKIYPIDSANLLTVTRELNLLREHFKFAKKTVVGWRSLCVAQTSR
jgi:hypothetical protein